jgi:outer membrane lipoprotein-sorting protein
VKKAIGSQLRFACVLILFLQAGCISKKHTVPQDQRLLPAKSATKADLMKDLEKTSKQIRTLSATVSLDASRGGPTSGVVTEYREAKGYVLAERPSNIRIKALIPVLGSTAFDMVSDGRKYYLSIPSKNQWAEGDVNAPADTKTAKTKVVSLPPPQSFLDGLFVDISPYLENPDVLSTFQEATEGQRSYYVFTFMRKAESGRELQILEKLWIDRTRDLEVSRKQIFRPDGRIETEVEYSNYKSDGDVRFPETINMQWPVEEYSLKMTFQKTAFNQKLHDNTFNLERPAGSDLVQAQ